MFYIGNAAYVTATTCIKLALLLQYNRIFQENGLMRTIIIAMVVFTSLWGFAFSFIAWFPCFPIQKNWMGPTMDGICYGFGSEKPYPMYATFVAHASMNMVLDMIVFAIPLPLFFQQNVTSSTRVRLFGLFTMGFLYAIHFSRLRAC
jgi:hypothetical protein